MCDCVCARGAQKCVVVAASNTAFDIKARPLAIGERAMRCVNGRLCEAKKASHSTYDALHMMEMNM